MHGLFLQKAHALDFKSWQQWLDSVEAIDQDAEAKQLQLLEAGGSI